MRTRRQVDKFAERRAQLATSVLQTLGELGYARTSLREIAHNSEFTHGVVHYYFNDKIELITFAVRSFKKECVHRYDEIVATAATAEELRTGFGRAMAVTLTADTPLHRLWYDMRNQSLFEVAFRADVFELDAALSAMIWRVIVRHAELAGIAVPVTEPVGYAIFDGLFQQHLLRHVAGDDQSAAELEARSAALLEDFARPRQILQPLAG